MSELPKNAKDHYLGKGGKGKQNCAQSILQAFIGNFKIDEQMIKQFGGYGGGGAPEGVCGAYFAARHLLEKKSPDKLEEFDAFFLKEASSLSCKEIRGNRKLSCLGCIEKSAEFLARQ
jgi:hypothetical protein